MDRCGRSVADGERADLVEGADGRLWLAPGKVVG
jgi:hypothetical protein